MVYRDIKWHIRIYCWVIRGKDTGRVWRNPCTGVLMLFPSHEGSHRAHSSLSEENTGSCGSCSSQAVPLRPRFLSGLVTQTPSAWHVPKFLTPRRKAGVQHKPYCANSLGTVSYLSHSGKVSDQCRELLTSHVPRCQPSAIVQVELSKASSLGRKLTPP